MYSGVTSYFKKPSGTHDLLRDLCVSVTGNVSVRSRYVALCGMGLLVKGTCRVHVS
jgi:hypothetical protein